MIYIAVHVYGLFLIHVAQLSYTCLTSINLIPFLILNKKYYLAVDTYFRLCLEREINIFFFFMQKIIIPRRNLINIIVMTVTLLTEKISNKVQGSSLLLPQRCLYFPLFINGNALALQKKKKHNYKTLFIKGQMLKISASIFFQCRFLIKFFTFYQTA